MFYMTSSITERRVPEMIPVLGGQPAAGDVSHKPGGRLPLLSAMPRLDRGDEDELRVGDPLLLEPPADSDAESSFASLER